MWDVRYGTDTPRLFRSAPCVHNPEGSATVVHREGDPAPPGAGLSAYGGSQYAR